LLEFEACVFNQFENMKTYPSWRRGYMPNCIIIGAGPGLGEAIARRFGRSGFHIGLIARSVTNLKQQVSHLAGQGITVTWAQAEAGDLLALEAAISQIVGEIGECDVLIYNAAVMRPGNSLELSIDQIQEDFSVNVIGAIRAAQIVVPAMIEKGEGAILYTGGGLALEPFPEWTSLALGKAALRSLSLSLYKQLSPQGIHVSIMAICGIVEKGGPFDPDRIAEEYWRVATQPCGLEDREIIIQPDGTDPLYNDSNRIHAHTTILPHHARKNNE
jgi:short-subunit dehydrogenase